MTTKPKPTRIWSASSRLGRSGLKQVQLLWISLDSEPPPLWKSGLKLESLLNGFIGNSRNYRQHPSLNPLTVLSVGGLFISLLMVVIVFYQQKKESP